MEKKYELIENDYIEGLDKKLYRIKALKSFNGIKKGDVGGYIQSEENLSQAENCWISRDAFVFGNALVFGNARVYGNAHVYGDARVYGDTYVSGNARVFGDAHVSGDARVFGDAHIKYGVFTIPIVTFKEKEYIAASLNIYPNRNKYLLYKKVNKIDGKYFSIFDSAFEYSKKEITKIKNFDTNILTSCSSGLHFSTPDYWAEGNCLIAFEIAEKDIITCQEGKIRASKCKFVEEICCE